VSKGPIDLGKFEVYVNARPVRPMYTSQPEAMARAEKEAKTHRYVQVARVFKERAPKSIAKWEDGELI